jgi:hypothetical protein
VTISRGNLAICLKASIGARRRRHRSTRT